MVSGKKFIITGGTGSFGQTMVKHLLKLDAAEIRIFSRDEEKQDRLRNELNDSRVRFYIGDTRDYESVKESISGVDYVFHAAALKQVPSCEFFPEQAVATNIIGSENVLRAACESEVKSVVCLSTDKAVYPINAMGMSKALMEKLAQSFARKFSEFGTKISITRYGNVMMSRGSVIPRFINQLKLNLPITITDPGMTRFMLTLDDSVDLVMHAFTTDNSGNIFVKKAPACTLKVLAETLSELFKSELNLEVIGVRHGEKMHETLLSSEERLRTKEDLQYFCVDSDDRDLNYQLYFDQGITIENKKEAYTSENTNRLSHSELRKILLKLPEISELVEKK